MANNQSVRRHLDAFTRGRIIGKLEEGRSVTGVAAEFGIAHSIGSRLWRQFQTTGTAIRGFSSGRPRGTTPADDRYIVLQARRNRRQVTVFSFGIMLGSRADFHIFDAGSVNGTRYCNEILLPYVRLFRGAMGLQFNAPRQCTMSSHSSCQTALRE
ncbi:hypothetical protein TNCV_3901461 [Trichonephila clavipes]|nr:hypothetical protein TNCV_3901461 [Trichonephila clavipes]